VNERSKVKRGIEIVSEYCVGRVFRNDVCCLFHIVERVSLQ
jgi:hypothetical protein